MAQRIEVFLTCDPDSARGRDHAGETHIVGIDGVWYALEVCDTRNRKDLEPVRAYLSTHARVIDKQNLRHLLKLASGDNVRSLPTAKNTPVVQPAEPVAKPKAVAPSKGRAGRPTAKDRRHFCPFSESCPDAKYTSTTALLSHLENEHGITGSMAEVFGLDCPLCGSHGGPKLGFHLMYGVHKRHRPTVSEAFAKAYANGDKHGIATKVYQRLGVA